MWLGKGVYSNPLNIQLSIVRGILRAGLNWVVSSRLKRGGNTSSIPQNTPVSPWITLLGKGDIMGVQWFHFFLFIFPSQCAPKPENQATEKRRYRYERPGYSRNSNRLKINRVRFRSWLHCWGGGDKNKPLSWALVSSSVKRILVKEPFQL